MEIGQISTITFNDNTTAKIKLVHIDTYSTMPSDYWFDYVDGETNKQLIHPEYLKNPIIKSPIVLPIGLVELIIKPDLDVNSYEYKLEEYLKNNFNEINIREARNLFYNLERTSGREYIEQNYLNHDTSSN